VEMTILQFAESIRGLMSEALEIEYKPLPQDDPKQRRPDITRAQTLLGWMPRVGLQQGLRETIEYFKAKVRGDQLEAASKPS
jgi:dTDP-glucose 4,6-dehydratase